MQSLQHRGQFFWCQWRRSRSQNLPYWIFSEFLYRLIIWIFVLICTQDCVAVGHDLEEGCGHFDTLLALIPPSHAASYESEHMFDDIWLRFICCARYTGVWLVLVIAYVIAFITLRLDSCVFKTVCRLIIHHLKEWLRSMHGASGSLVLLSRSKHSDGTCASAAG